MLIKMFLLFTFIEDFQNHDCINMLHLIDREGPLVDVTSWGFDGDDVGA